MQVKAVARNVPGSARKLRLITDRLTGLTVDEALALLRYAPSPHARTVSKVVLSAAANAENNFNLDVDDLVVESAFTDEGRTMRRYKARSRGRVSPILKRSSHVTVVLGDEGGS